MPRGHQDFWGGNSLARASLQAGDPQRIGHYRLTAGLAEALTVIHEITASAASGAVVTGIDSARAQASRQFVLRRMPAG
jgi:hypothetical protein